VFIKISVENFKAFATQVNAPLAPLTLIYGPNSSGKSSILDTLLILKQTVSPANTSRSPLAFTGTTDFGNYRNIAFKHDVDAVITVSAAVMPHNITRPIYGVNLPIDKYFVDLHYCADTEGQVLLPKIDISVTDSVMPAFSFKAVDAPIATPLQVGPNMGMRRSYSSYGLERISSDAPFIHVLFDRFIEGDLTRLQAMLTTHREAHINRLATILQSQSGVNVVSEDAREQSERLIDQRIKAYNGYTFKQFCEDLTAFGRAFVVGVDALVPYQIFSPQNVLTAPLRLETMLGLPISVPDPSFLLHNALQALTSELDALNYIGPHREEPKRMYIYRGNAPLNVGARGEDFADALFANQQYEDQLNALCDLMDIGFHVRLRKAEGGQEFTDAFSIALIDRVTETQVGLNDVGYGISQVLPVLLQIIMSQDSPLIIEEPELHLNPRLQATLGQVLAQEISGRPHRQIIVETHSEHLLLRLQRCIRVGALNPSLLSVLYVSHEPDGSHVQQMEITADGELKHGWPQGFFDDAIREMFLT